jgi:hypothetical protein
MQLHHTLTKVFTFHHDTEGDDFVAGEKDLKLSNRYKAANFGMLKCEATDGCYRRDLALLR